MSSASKLSPSSAVAKYPRERPQSAIVPATRPIICLTERSRAGELSCPRKYFWATMFVAFCDHVRRELDVGLLEGDLVAVTDARVAQLPLDRVERMDPGRREATTDRQRLRGVDVLCDLGCEFH